MKKQIFIFILIIASLTCCRPPRNNTFYWGDYSLTLYELKKNPDKETLEAHKQQILLIFDESIKNNLRIPPGISAEYGYILLKEGKEKEGIEYLDKEITLYPESAVFIQKIKAEFVGREK